MRSLPATADRDETWVLVGGTNTEAPQIALKPGMVTESLNFEPAVAGGYRRMAGCERHDGRPSPSDALYWVLPVEFRLGVMAGQSIIGEASAATGVVIATTPSEIIIAKLDGVFESGENLNIVGQQAVDVLDDYSVPMAGIPETPEADDIATVRMVNKIFGAALGTGEIGGDTGFGITTVVAITTDVASPLAAMDPADGARYSALAANVWRADILAVPGSGPVRGVWSLDDTVYAFRDDAMVTQCVMHKATSTGWQAVTLFEELAFTAGSSAFAEGGNVTQGGVSATVRRVVLQSGSWAGSTAAGRLIVSGRTGGNFAAGALGGSGVATAGGAQAQIFLLPGGTYEFVTYNFTGSSATRRMYGCDGVNRGFEFDGEVFVPIATGMAQDKPEHIAAHQKHLFFSFSGSLQHSSTGFPYQWAVVTGAAELGIGDAITALLPASGDAQGAAMLVGGERQAHVLYGTSSQNWKLVQLDGAQGVIGGTAQAMDGMRYLSEFGVTGVALTANYGNFQAATITHPVQTFVNGHRGMPVRSCIVRGRNQYRLYYVDGSALIVGGEKAASMVAKYPFNVTCVCSEIWSDGAERVFAGADNGFVYELDRGTSMDGEAIDAFLRLPFWSSRSPGVKKRYRRAVLHATSEGYSTLRVAHVLDDESDDITASPATTSDALVKAGYWDSFTWDEFYWDGKTSQPIRIRLYGSGANMSLLMGSTSDAESPVTLHDVTITFAPRRKTR